MHRTSAHHLLQEDILSLNCEDLTFLIYEQIQSCKLNRTLMLLLMWNLSSIYPISKIFSLVFKKLNYFKDIKLLSFIARYRPWNVHVLANTPIHTIQTLYWTVHTKCFLHGGHTPFWCSSNLQGHAVTNIFSFFFYPQFNCALQSTDNELLFWGEIHYHWHLPRWFMCVQT